MKATHVRDLGVSRSGAKQALYKLDTPYKYDDESGAECDHVVVSAVFAMYSGPETYIFPADETGEVISWGELPGSYRGGLDHARAIRGFESEVAA